MKTKYGKHVSRRKTSQKDPILGREDDMVANNAGGHVFSLDSWSQLDRFLVLGSEGNTYYCTEKKLTQTNAANVMRCIAEDGIRVVNRIIEFHKDNRAPKMEPLLFVLAMCAKLGYDGVTRRAANDAVKVVCGIPTHLFTFMEYVKDFGGWGRGSRRAIADWYTSKDLDKLAYQVVKYRNRAGWTHRDALRVAHPKTDDAKLNALFKYITHGHPSDMSFKTLPKIIKGFEKANQATEVNKIIELIEKYNLPWECVPTEFMKSFRVNKMLLENMPVTATMRQLGRLSAIGLLLPMSDSASLVINRLSNNAALQKAKIHPIQVLAALTTYRQGCGARGSLSWTPNQNIVDVLDEAFYATFKNIEPTNKRIYIGLDVSGSMDCGEVASIPGLTPRIASAAMCMATVRIEKQYHIAAFTSRTNGVLRRHNGEIHDVAISPRQRLDTIIETVSGLTFGGTDCALPMLDALKRKMPIDAFIVYTDSETWAGKIHPVQALQEYRKQMNIPAKLIVVGMVANEFTVADPQDKGMLDVVGFDTASPSIMSDFICDRL